MIKLRNHKTKYAFIDQKKNLRGRPLNLTLVWNVMPRVGERPAVTRCARCLGGPRARGGWVLLGVVRGRSVRFLALCGAALCAQPKKWWRAAGTYGMVNRPATGGAGAMREVRKGVHCHPPTHPPTHPRTHCQSSMRD